MESCPRCGTFIRAEDFDEDLCMECLITEGNKEAIEQTRARWEDDGGD